MVKNNRIICAVLALYAAACDGSNPVDNQAVSDPRTISEGSRQEARSGSRKAASGELPPQGEDNSECEGQAIGPAGNANEVAGVTIGMPIDQIRERLRCYETHLFYKNGIYFTPPEGGPIVEVHAWVLDAERSTGGRGEHVEILVAGPRGKQRAFELHQAVYFSRQDPPDADLISERLRAQYGLPEYLRSLETADGQPISNKYAPPTNACVTPTTKLCGRQVSVGLTRAPENKVASYQITYANSAQALPILMTSERK